MFKIAICEDDKEQRNYIKKLIERCENSNVQEIKLFDSGEVLVSAYKNKERFSIIFLDMQMSGINGIQTAEIIRKIDKNTIIIIITAILEYAVLGYSVHAYDFILKPIDEDKFKRIFNKAMKKIMEKKIQVYSIQMRDVMKVIQLSEIIYFESEKKKVKIHCLNGIVYNNESISDVEKKIKHIKFVRISRFYILNMEYIKEIRNKDILLLNGESLRYGEKFKKESYLNYVMGEIE